VYAEVCCDVYFDELGTLQEPPPDEDELADRLLSVRLVAAMRLQKLDPLLLLMGEICSKLGLEIVPSRTSSIITDLGREANIGKFECFTVGDSATGKKIMVNAVATDENPADKAKEWGARRFALLYRMLDGKVADSDYQGGLFVLDGTWEEKDVTRLFRSGWNEICRLGELEAALRRVFSLDAKVRRSPTRNNLLELEDVGDNA
jgi:hypothetical protein